MLWGYRCTFKWYFQRAYYVGAGPNIWPIVTWGRTGSICKLWRSVQRAGKFPMLTNTSNTPLIHLHYTSSQTKEYKRRSMCSGHEKYIHKKNIEEDTMHSTTKKWEPDHKLHTHRTDTVEKGFFFSVQTTGDKIKSQVYHRGTSTLINKKKKCQLCARDSAITYDLME